VRIDPTGVLLSRRRESIRATSEAATSGDERRACPGATAGVLTLIGDLLKGLVRC